MLQRWEVECTCGWACLFEHYNVCVCVCLYMHGRACMHVCVFFLMMCKQKHFLPTSFPAFLVWFLCGHPVFQLWSTSILLLVLNLYARRRQLVSVTPRPVSSFERDPVPSVQEAEWVQKIFPLLGFQPRTVQPIASHYTDCPVPAAHIALYAERLLLHLLFCCNEICVFSLNFHLPLQMMLYHTWGITPVHETVTGVSCVYLV